MKTSRRMEEHDEQVALFQWLDMNHVLAFAIPNAGKRGFGNAFYMKREGLRSGVPDVMICEPSIIENILYCGLFLENKSQKGVLEETQKAWLEELSKRGYMTRICRPGQAIPMVKEYLKGKVYEY